MAISVSNGNLRQNVHVHFTYMSKVYVYTLFLAPKCTKRTETNFFYLNNKKYCSFCSDEYKLRLIKQSTGTPRLWKRYKYHMPEKKLAKTFSEFLTNGISSF